MAKYQNDSMLDAALTWLQDNCDKICILTAQPTSVDNCTASTVLAVTTISTGSFTLADDSTVGGRKITVSSQVTLAVQTTGVAEYIALFSSDSTNHTTGLHYVTMCTTQNLASTSNSVTIPSWDITIDDAT